MQELGKAVLYNALAHSVTPRELIILTGIHIRDPNEPDSYKRRPNKSIGPKTGRPTNTRGELPSLLSQRVRQPDLPGHVAAPPT